MFNNRFVLLVHVQGLMKIVFSTLIFLLLCLLTSCNNSSTKKSIDDTVDKAGLDTVDGNISTRQSFFTGEKPPVLFITNKVQNDSLSKLLSSRPGRNKRKWILQFFVDTSSRLRVLIIPTAANNRDFVFEDAVIPEVGDSLMASPFPKENVFLGDLQFVDRPAGPVDPPHGPRDRDDAFTELGKHVFPNNAVGWEYIWFVPEVVPINVAVGGATIDKRYVVYHLEAHSAPPASSLAPKLTTELDYANPSPPRRLQ